MSIYSKILFPECIDNKIIIFFCQIHLSAHVYVEIGHVMKNYHVVSLKTLQNFELDKNSDHVKYLLHHTVLPKTVMQMKHLPSTQFY